MKKHLLKSRTLLAAVSLPVVGWTIQWLNGGLLPENIQTWGPLLVSVGVILLRIATTTRIHF